jgi:hypothetical protein
MRTTSLELAKQLKECSIPGCKAEAPFFWRLKLCTEHYEEMERIVHDKEKANRKANAIIGIIAGKQYDEIECPNGKNCRFCKEFDL